MIKTINLKGKEYAPVSARVEQFHKDYKNGCIQNSYEFKEGYAIFTSTVSYEGDPEKTRTFTGHSFGKVTGDKSFEKLETVAVGRALAFAGYLAGGEIASFEEVEQLIK